MKNKFRVAVLAFLLLVSKFSLAFVSDPHLFVDTFEYPISQDVGEIAFTGDVTVVDYDKNGVEKTIHQPFIRPILIDKEAPNVFKNGNLCDPNDPAPKNCRVSQTMHFTKTSYQGKNYQANCKFTNDIHGPLSLSIKLLIDNSGNVGCVVE